MQSTREADHVRYHNTPSDECSQPKGTHGGKANDEPTTLNHRLIRKILAHIPDQMPR